MKDAKFYNNVSLSNILMDSRKVISALARNEDLVKAFEDKAYDSQFPIYFTGLKKRFYTEVKEQRLRRAAAKIISNIFILNDEFHPISQNIIRYLREKDLEFLCSNVPSSV